VQIGESELVSGPKSITLLIATAAMMLAPAGSPCAAQNRLAERRQARQEARQQAQAQGNHAGQWLRRYKGLPPDQQQKALDNDPQFRSLPPMRQQILRERLQRFSSLPPRMQDRILQRMETWEHLTPAQKQQARQLYRSSKTFRPNGDRKCAPRSATSASCLRSNVSRSSSPIDSRASFHLRSAACSAAPPNCRWPQRGGRTSPHRRTDHESRGDGSLGCPGRAKLGSLIHDSRITHE